MRVPILSREFTPLSSPTAQGPSPSGYSIPSAFSRPSWRRRIEVFSPKVGRRLSLGSYDAYRTWLVIEANPAITTFCERPALVEGVGSAVIDFWVQLRGAPAGEFWLIETRRPRRPPTDSSSHELKLKPSRLHGLPTRQILQADLSSWDVPIANWGRIVPYLTSHRRFRDALLEQSIVVFLLAAQTLDTVLERFGDHDATAVEAALFTLVAQGRVRSPDLAVAALSGRTRFQRI